MADVVVGIGDLKPISTSEKCRKTHHHNRPNYLITPHILKPTQQRDARAFFSFACFFQGALG
ncbi:hypothetical protein [Moraxella lacunata]|uniref:hypothetical protein n=1 Tax=Moraxella lacunata TaxID=477 RepID=UPI003EE40442